MPASSSSSSDSDSDADSEAASDAVKQRDAEDAERAERDLERAAEKEAAAIAAVEEIGAADLIVQARRAYRAAITLYCTLVAALLVVWATGFALHEWYSEPLIERSEVGAVFAFVVENLGAIHTLHYLGTLAMLAATIGYLLAHHRFVVAYDEAPVPNKRGKPLPTYTVVLGLISVAALAAVVASGYQLPPKTEIGAAPAPGGEHSVALPNDPTGALLGPDAPDAAPTLLSDAERGAYDAHTLYLPQAHAFLVLILMAGLYMLQRCKIPPEVGAKDGTRSTPKRQ